MGHLTDKLFTESQLKQSFSMAEYWEEILKREEPRRSSCCRDELSAIISTFTPAQIIHMVNEGLKAIDDETNT